MSREEKKEKRVSKKKKQSDVDQILTFAHQLSSAPGIIGEAKFQPKVTSKVKKVKLPTESKKLTAAQRRKFGVVEGGMFEANVSSQELPAAEVRDDILRIGVDKFKALPITVLQNYFRELEGGNEPPQTLKRAQLIAYILRRTGIGKVEGAR